MKFASAFKHGFRKAVPAVLILILLLVSFVLPVFASSPGPAPAVQSAPLAILADTTAASLPFAGMAIGGFGIVWFVTGIVSWVKKLGVKGVWLTVTSMGVGLLLGIAYQYYLTPLTTYALWFVAILYGLFLGFVACGIYDAYGNGSTTVPTNTTPTA